MAKRSIILICLLGLVLALFSPIVPVGAQDSGSSLEFTGERTLRVDSWAGQRAREGSGYRSPYRACTFTAGAPDDIRPWLRQLLQDVDGATDEQLQSFDSVTSLGASFSFGSATRVGAGFCPSSTGVEIGASNISWWDLADPGVQPGFEGFWSEAFDQIVFPDLSIDTAPNAGSAPFLTNLPVGMRPSQEVVALSGTAAIPVNVQTITVNAVPRSIIFRSGGKSVACEAPFPSYDELINELEPACSLRYEDAIAKDATIPLILEVVYDLSTVCAPFCGRAAVDAPRDVTLSVEIPVGIAEATGLR